MLGRPRAIDVQWQGRVDALHELCGRLHERTRSRFVFVVGPQNELIAGAGEVEDVDARASQRSAPRPREWHWRTLLNGARFSVKRGSDATFYLHELRRDVLLVVGFDRRSGLGLVRREVLRYEDRMARLFATARKRPTVH